MYIPTENKENDEHKLLEFMQANSFAILINSCNNEPVATHLPFIIEKRNHKIYLISHLAKANPQCEFIFNSELLIIFHGPHAYISPSHYESKQNVPTWNYTAVHAYGKAKIIPETTAVINVLERTIKNYEPAYYNQWKELSPDYITGMIKGITAFEIEVNLLEGKFKLSQNKTDAEKRTIISHLEKSENTLQSGIAAEMKKNLK